MADEILIVHIPDHAAHARDRLLSRYRDKPRIEALINALCEGVQLLEYEGWNLLVSTTFEAATGKHLEDWGELVNEQRGSLDDVNYRRFISARILVNNCEGVTDEVIEIFELITDAESIQHFNVYPAGYQLQCLRQVEMSEEVRTRVRLMMADIKPGGVGIVSLVEAITAPFAWPTVPGALGFDEGQYARII